jgi:hypothetical protein
MSTALNATVAYKNALLYLKPHEALFLDITREN